MCGSVIGFHAVLGDDKRLPESKPCVLVPPWPPLGLRSRFNRLRLWPGLRLGLRPGLRFGKYLWFGFGQGCVVHYNHDFI